MNQRHLGMGLVAAAVIGMTCNVAACRAGQPHASGTSGASSAATGASDSTEVSELLDRVRDAVGYARIAEHPTGFLLEGEATIAQLPSRFSFLFGGDTTAVQRVDGAISTAAAINGDEVWITDIGGETLRLMGPGRERTQLGLLVLNYGYLGERRLSFTRDSAADTEGEAALAFTVPAAHISGRLFIDRGTWLPARWEYTSGGDTTTITLDGYREHGGVMFPSRFETVGNSGPRMVTSIERITDAPTFIRSPYEMIESAPADTAWDAASAPELEVVRAPTGHLLVHPLINGQDLGWFIFDTGAGNSVLSTPVVTALGLDEFGEVPASGVGGRTAASFCRPASLRLGAMTMHDPLMVVLDLSFLEQHMGRPIAGLIGYNLLARSVVRLDATAPAISLSDPSAAGDALEWTPLVIDQRLPHVEAEFEGHHGLFRLDTGAAQMTVALHKPTVDRLDLLTGREVGDSKSGGVGGAVAMKAGLLRSFTLGGHRSEDLPAQFALEAKGVFADATTDGNIGGKLLEPFVLVFDYPNQRIAFLRRSP